MNAKEAIEGYKEWYKEKFGFGPSEKLIDIFCRINGIEREEGRCNQNEAQPVAVEDRKRR